MHTKFGAELSWAQNSALNFHMWALKCRCSIFVRSKVGAHKFMRSNVGAQKSAFNCQHSKVATLNCRAFKIWNSIVCAQSQRSYVGTQLSCAQKLALKYTHLKRLALKSRCSSYRRSKVSVPKCWMVTSALKCLALKSCRARLLCVQKSALKCLAINSLRSTVGPQISCAQRSVHRCL